MSEVKTADIEIKLNEGSVKISGSEEFVEKNMETVFAFIKSVGSILSTTDSKVDKPLNASISVAEKEQPQKENAQDFSEDKYVVAGVYHVDPEDESISILKTVPGNNKAEKAKNIALIVLHIRKRKINGKDLIPICEKHACYDASNFSTVFRNEKTNIIRKGTGQTWTIELTRPGEEAAIALLEEMANDKK